MKYRKKFIVDNDIINYLKHIFFEVCKRCCFEFDTIGASGCHINLFVWAKPKYYPPRVLQFIKNITA
jgi:REP element-mobilizing transposase RayT